MPLFAATTSASSSCATQVALFDRIHNIRVKHIQEEYQKYMERVRSKAQSAIDQANANYQHHRAMLTARVDAMVHYLQQQYLRVSVATIHCMLQSKTCCWAVSTWLHTWSLAELLGQLHCTDHSAAHSCMSSSSAFVCPQMAPFCR